MLVDTILSMGDIGKGQCFSHWTMAIINRRMELGEGCQSPTSSPSSSSTMTHLCIPATSITLGTHSTQGLVSLYEEFMGVALHHLWCDFGPPHKKLGSLRRVSQVRSGSSLGSIALLDGRWVCSIAMVGGVLQHLRCMLRHSSPSFMGETLQCLWLASTSYMLAKLGCMITIIGSQK